VANFLYVLLRDAFGGDLMRRLRFLYLSLAFFAYLILTCCGGGGDGGGTPATGTLSLGLTDQSTDEYKAVYVTIAEVQVHMPGDTWKVVAAPNKTYNLLDLVNGVREKLGIAELNAGDYTQMRLIIGDKSDGGINILSKRHRFANYVIDLNDVEHELKVPSGYKTGVKIVQGFTISPDQTTELILDFSASESVVVAGASDQWLLKPTIKVRNTEEWSIIGGTVSDGEGNFLPGALVSAQIYDNDPSVDPKDQVITEASTVTDENGQYRLFVKPGTYELVAYTANYNPAVECSVNLATGEVVEDIDFTLTQASTGTVSATVLIPGADSEQYATISFRQPVDCDQDGNVDTEIEVKLVNIINNATDDVILREGTYHVVASSYDRDTLDIDDVNVTEGSETALTVNLTM
jgi:hypothetical protein